MRLVGWNYPGDWHVTLDTAADSGPAIEAEILAAKLMSLVSEEERACLTLAYAAGMSHPEICDITRLPLGTVKSHISRGKQKVLKDV